MHLTGQRGREALTLLLLCCSDVLMLSGSGNRISPQMVVLVKVVAESKVAGDAGLELSLAAVLFSGRVLASLHSEGETKGWHRRGGSGGQVLVMKVPVAAGGGDFLMPLQGTLEPGSGGRRAQGSNGTINFGGPGEEWRVDRLLTQHAV